MVQQSIPIAERKYALSHATNQKALDLGFEIERHLQGSGIDILTAKAVSYRLYLLPNMLFT